MERRRVESAVRFFDSLTSDAPRSVAHKKQVNTSNNMKVSDITKKLENISEADSTHIQKSVILSDVQQKSVIQCLKLQNYLDVSYNIQQKPPPEQNLVKELEAAMELLHKSTENLQNPPDLLLPPDVEAKQIYENFEKEVSPYNTFTIPKDVAANEVFKPTFEMFPEVRKSFRKISREVKGCMRPMRIRKYMER